MRINESHNIYNLIYHLVHFGAPHLVVSYILKLNMSTVQHYIKIK